MSNVQIVDEHIVLLTSFITDEILPDCDLLNARDVVKKFREFKLKHDLAVPLSALSSLADILYLKLRNNDLEEIRLKMASDLIHEARILL